MLNAWMVKMFGSSWKTSMFGSLSFIAGMVVTIPAIGNRWPILPEIAKYVLITATGGGLLVAKDKGVTGGQTLEPNSVPDAILHIQKAQVEAVEGK